MCVSLYMTYITGLFGVIMKLYVISVFYHLHLHQIGPVSDKGKKYHMILFNILGFNKIRRQEQKNI